MLDRLRPLLVMLLVFGLASPAFAKDDDDDEDKSEESDEDQGGDEGEGEDEDLAEDVGFTESPDEPDQWERPPEEEEAAPKVEKRKLEKPTRVNDRPISAGLLLGYGFKTDRREALLGADPYTFGAGLRGGYSLDMDIYLGAYFVYYLGSSQEGDFGPLVGTQTSTANYMHFGVEVGYDWWAGAALIIRPSLRLGMALGITDQTGETTSVGDLAFHPGLSVIHPWDNLFIGGYASGDIVTGDGIGAISLFATFGMRFEG